VCCSIRQSWLAGLVLLLLAGCSVTGGSREIDGAVSVDKPAGEIAEAQLVDVWIELFDPGELPEDEDDARGLSLEIREAEARYLPQQLRDSVERSGYWGAVRVVPRDIEGGEVLVRGTILVSDGERLELQIAAFDATGRAWFERSYVAESDSSEHDTALRRGIDVYQNLFNTIANDLAEFRATLNDYDIIEVRRVALLRFAADLAPDAFSAHLTQDRAGRYRVVRLPARDDPMFRRVQAIRERDALLVDTLNGHFDNFRREMHKPYVEWRRARTSEAEALRQIEREALTQKLIGVAAIAGAIAIEVLGGGENTGSLRDVMILGGAYSLKSGFDKDSETMIHSDAIIELGDSFSAETQPLIVEVEGEVHELTGSAEEQYAEWRALLRRIYATETGLGGGAD